MVGTVGVPFRLSSSPGGLLPRGPHQNRTRRFPPSGSSADVAHGDAPQIRTRIRGTGRGYRANNATNLGQGSTTFRMSGDMSPDVNAPVMGPFERSHQHGPPLLGRVRGPTRSPTSSLVCSPPTPALPSAAAPVVPGRWPTLSLVRQGGRRASQVPGPSSFQRAVGSDPAGCASRLAHRVETAIAFRLHNALGTQNERYFVAVNPTAHSLACLRIGVFVTADAARLATGVGGSPFTGRVSHPLDGKQSFMTSSHRHSPLTSLAWSHVGRDVSARVAVSGKRQDDLVDTRRATSSSCVATGPSDRREDPGPERRRHSPGVQRARRNPVPRDAEPRHEAWDGRAPEGIVAKEHPERIDRQRARRRHPDGPWRWRVLQ